MIDKNNGTLEEFFTYHSPIGLLQFTASQGQITSVCFVDREKNNSGFDTTLQKNIIRQMDGYFEGTLFTFDLPLAPQGTVFQKKVWKALETIDYGHSLSYGELALKLKDKNLVRAVGGANSKNPVAIIVPCHRVIGVNNKLVGYAGGLWRKKWLLRHELDHCTTKNQLF